MCSLVLIMPLLFTVLASPALRSRAVQDVDTYGNPVDAQGNPVDLEGNMFDNNPSLASANLEGAGWTDSLGTTLDRQGYPLSTDPSPTNLGNNIYLGAPGQQDGLIAAVDRIKEGFVPTASNPCPNLHTLCSKVMQYFPLAYIIKADPWDAEEDPDFQQCGRREIYCCIRYNAKTRRGYIGCYNAFNN